MKNKGISLIVLIITIVVIIILAAAIILNLTNTNIIGNANKAVFKQDIQAFKDELSMYVADKFVDNSGKYNSKLLNADRTQITYGGEKQVGTVSDIISIEGTRYEEMLFIQEGQIMIDEKKASKNEIDWAKEENVVTKLVGITETVPHISRVDVNVEPRYPEKAQSYTYVIYEVDKDGNKIEIAKKENETTSSVSFDNLKPGTKYEIVTTVKYNDGTNEELVKEVTTQEFDGTVEIIQTPVEEWVSDKVEIELSYENEIPSGYELQYKIGTEEWKEYTEKFEVTENILVKARLYNETTDEEIGVNSKAVSNIDNVAPTVPSTLELTVSGTTITAVASGSTDEGIGNITYKYSINNSTWQESGTFSGLNAQTKYTVYVKSIDGLGNESESKQNSATTEYKQTAVNTIVQNSNATIKGKNPGYDNPVIPVGFKAYETTDATWKDTNNDGKPDGWNNGLVIQDGSGNEFVWVPVDGTNVEYKKWNGSINTDYTVTKDKVEDDTLPSGVPSETAQITKYGGFYVARYEAGLPDAQTTETLMATKTFSADNNNRTDIGKAQSKSDKIVWNRIDYNNAKIVSENVVSTNYVQSGLITGTQWDTMLTFLSGEVNVDTNCIAWGNYYDKYGYTINGYYRTKDEDVVYSNGEYTKSANGYLLLQTGKFGSLVSEGSPKNLYDVAGNVWEWSAETVKTKGGSYTAVGNKLLRGGGYIDGGSNFVASYRHGSVAAATTYPDVGFRFVLYIK